MIGKHFSNDNILDCQMKLHKCIVCIHNGSLGSHLLLYVEVFCFIIQSVCYQEKKMQFCDFLSTKNHKSTHKAQHFFGANSSKGFNDPREAKKFCAL